MIEIPKEKKKKFKNKTKKRTETKPAFDTCQALRTNTLLLTVVHMDTKLLNSISIHENP